MDPITLIAGLTAAYNTVVKLVDAGREMEDVMGALAGWLGKLEQLNATDSKPAGVFTKLTRPGDASNLAMQAMQRKHTAHKQWLDMMSKLTLAYGPGAVQEFLAMKRSIEQKAERDAYNQSKARKNAAIMSGYLAALFAALYGLYLIGETFWVLYQDKISG